MRQSGATARLMLERAAATKWGVPAAECKARNEQVTHTASSHTAPYGDLVALAAKQPVPKKEELKLKTPAEFKYIGKGVPIYDQTDIVSGKSVFGMDARVPNMVYASIERSPVLGGKLKSVDDSEARKVRGVQKIVQIAAFKPPYGFQALGGVAVIADNTWAAMQGRKKLKVDWDLGPNTAYESASYKAALLETVRKPQKGRAQCGRCGRRIRQGRQDSRSRILRPYAFACGDGAG
jgi:isoquinoline 1-oxidoreductase beta subunit